jgi:large repetitive protein
MKNILILLIPFTFLNVFSQEKRIKEIITAPKCVLENYNGQIINDCELFQKISETLQKKIKSPNIQLPSEICTNGGFEDYETIGNDLILKNFNSFVSNFSDLTPITATENIPVSTATNISTKSVTVPSNYIDQYIGNINGFGQNVLKVGRIIDTFPNPENQAITQAIRFKNSNENELKFNYKVIVQSSNSQNHIGVQPFFLARIVDVNDNIVSEFTLVADEFDCNLTFLPGSSTNLGYTNNWQTCTLDISSIPNLQNFRIDFIAATCGPGGHFAYAYIDDICIQQSNQTNQGTVTLDSFNSNCPSSQLNICGKFTIPNTGTNTTIVSSVVLNLFDENQNIVYTNSTPTTLDLVNKTFCFNLNLANYPSISNANYNVGAVVNYSNLSTNCISNIFPAKDNDAAPGFDISFNNCNYPCNLISQDFTTTICDLLDDSTEIQDLTQYNLNLANSLNFNFIYYKTLNGAQNQTITDRILDFTNYNLVLGNNTIYVRILLSQNCFKIVKLKIELHSLPIINIEPKQTICENFTLKLDAGVGFDSYSWSTGEINQYIIISNPGIYEVIVTKNFAGAICSNTKKIEANVSNKANITSITTSDWTEKDNVISVFQTGIGNYEYSLDNIHYQDTSTFSGLENGNYTVYVRDKNGCGTTTQEVFLLMYPKFFTPNNDGINDFWKIKFSENEPNLNIKIFDRFGKFLKEIPSNSEGWNGQFIEKPLPANDYWFVVTRENGIQYKGHFALKR